MILRYDITTQTSELRVNGYWELNQERYADDDNVDYEYGDYWELYYTVTGEDKIKKLLEFLFDDSLVHTAIEDTLAEILGIGEEDNG